MSHHARYQQLFDLYRSLYEENKTHFRTLAKIEGISIENETGW